MDKFINEKLIMEMKLEKKLENPCSTPYQYSDKIIEKVQQVLSDIDNNHNHSWAVEMYDRNKKNMDKVAICYRGNKIYYYEMFNKAYMYAKSLKAIGYKKNDKIPICITNIPEFVYLFIAVSLIGAKPVIVGDWFDKDYLTELLNNSKSKYMFIDDISYDSIRESIKNSNIENLVCFSLTDSLKKDKYGKSINPYEKIDCIKGNNIEKIKSVSSGKVYGSIEFEKKGSNYEEKVVENVELDDDFTITFTSGTTSPGHPKGVIQSNRSYITLSRFKESDVSGMPTMKNMSVLAHIPTYTHMELSCAISDTLYCGCTLNLEPFYGKDFFPYSLVINKPNFVPASSGFWVNLCKLLNFDELWKNVNMPYLMIPTVTGEACSPGEEKFLNFTARKHKFGVEKLPFPLSPVTFSIGGGTTESSGIFVTLFKSLQEKKISHLIRKETLGLTPHKFAEIEVLNEKGNYCKINEPGLLVAMNPCAMKGYTDETLNKDTYVVDSNGRIWENLGTYSYKDRTGRIKMKGRMNSDLHLANGRKIPYYMIEDCILADTKNVMSCSLVNTIDNNLICHIELQPYKQKSEEYIVKGIIERLENTFTYDVNNQLYFRLRDNCESFPLDPSGKRSLSTLRKIGIDDKTLSFDELKNNCYKKENYNKNLVKNR